MTKLNPLNTYNENENQFIKILFSYFYICLALNPTSHLGKEDSTPGDLEANNVALLNNYLGILPAGGIIYVQ